MKKILASILLLGYIFVSAVSAEEFGRYKVKNNDVLGRLGFNAIAYALHISPDQLKSWNSWWVKRNMPDLVKPGDVFLYKSPVILGGSVKEAFAALRNGMAEELSSILKQMKKSDTNLAALEKRLRELEKVPVIAKKEVKDLHALLAKLASKKQVQVLQKKKKEDQKIIEQGKQISGIKSSGAAMLAAKKHLAELKEYLSNIQKAQVAITINSIVIAAIGFFLLALIIIVVVIFFYLKKRSIMIAQSDNNPKPVDLEHREGIMVSVDGRDYIYYPVVNKTAKGELRYISPYGEGHKFPSLNARLKSSVQSALRKSKEVFTGEINAGRLVPI